MNINIKKRKVLTSVLFAFGLLVSTSSTGFAWHGHGYGHGYGHGPWGGGWHGGWRGGWHRNFYAPVFYHPMYRPVYRHCGVVGGHWQGGHWVPAHRACW
ncbi:MAG: hypothetical protein WC785_09240 [Tatlockia sp.]